MKVYREEVEDSMEELQKSGEKEYNNIIEQIRETYRDIETLYLSPPTFKTSLSHRGEVNLLLKEKMLSIIASSSYKSKHLILENFDYNNASADFRVEISENFESLTLNEVYNAMGFIKSRKFSKIKSLELCGSSYKNEVIEVRSILKSFPSLENLILSNIDVVSFKDITNLSSLSKLHIVNYREGETRIEDINFSAINENLKTIFLQKVKAENISLLINSSKNLEHLALEDVNSEGISFKDFPYLSFLDIEGYNLKNFNFNELSNKIEDLRLTDNSLSGDICIKGFPKLMNLSLRKNNISSLELIDLPRINRVDINKNPLDKLSFQDCSCLQYLEIPSSVKVLTSNSSEIANKLMEDSKILTHDEYLSFIASRRPPLLK